MRPACLLVLTSTCLLIIAGNAHAAPAAAVAHDHLVPDRHDSAQMRTTQWQRLGQRLTAPTQWTTDGGTRVAGLIQVSGGGPDLTLEARGVDVADAGPWLPMEETFKGAGHRVAVVDLGRRWSGAEIRMTAADHKRVGAVSWELIEPRFPDAGRRSREAAAAGTGMLFAVDPILASIGVVSRQSWGARPTGCSSTEDDWYRMAIHHTAGSQTSGGTVVGALKSVQAYTMDSGNFCDIPYQFLVGHDGSLYEGRSLALRSGATGGGNNDGNIAVSFLGCYHPNSCPGGNSHAATEPMMTGAHLLIQTLTRIHSIVSDSATIRGHRDWPGNSTACPGEFVHARLAELRVDKAWYAGAELGRSFPANSDEPREVSVGEPSTMWIELTNTGSLRWEPGRTFLATTSPRDSESALYDPSWPATNRVATVTAPVEPGQVGRFEFSVRAHDIGDYEQQLGLVHEEVSWFADTPWGGGPSDDAIILRIRAVAGDPSTDDPRAPPDDDASDEPLRAGCSASSSSAPGAVLVLLAGLLVARRRRRSSWPGR